MTNRAIEVLKKLGVGEEALSGRCAVVVGGALGIGRATAELLAFAGARVAILDRLPSGAHVAAGVEAAGGMARFYLCDVANPVEQDAALNAARAELGAIDILVNSAVYASLETWADTTVDVWDRVLVHYVRVLLNRSRRLPVENALRERPHTAVH